MTRPTRTCSTICAGIAQLFEGALLRRFVGTPAEKLRSVSESLSGKMIVFDFDDQARSERLPFGGALGAPAARSPWRDP